MRSISLYDKDNNELTESKEIADEFASLFEKVYLSNNVDTTSCLKRCLMTSTVLTVLLGKMRICLSFTLPVMT